MRHWITFIAVFAVVLNFGYAAILMHHLARRRPWPRGLAAAVCAWALLMSGLFLLQIFAPYDWKPFMRHWLYFPLAVQMVWNLLFIQVLSLGAIVYTVIIRRVRPVKSAAPLTAEGISRRRFLYLTAYGAAPATAIGMGVHGTLTHHDLRVRELRVPIAGLPPALEGFTIAHVSDLHSGLFCGPHRLKIILDATNATKADLIVLTGDIINNEMGEFAAALEVMKRMESRHGIYLCEGNHDVIPGPGLVREACAQNNLPMLWNSTAAVPVGNARLVIGGLPWMKHLPPENLGMIDALYPARQLGDVRLLLAHYPDLFDGAVAADLVLAGHTHGGQIMCGDVGFGPLFFKYWSGPYRRDNRALVVSNGAGDWFPCRIGAPAEIGLLHLTAG
jgi:predicted MPP superfamily phosphohydrolase